MPHHDFSQILLTKITKLFILRYFYTNLFLRKGINLKKIFILLTIVIIMLFTYCFSAEKQNENNIINTFNLNILDKKYTCYDYNCYDFNSFHYNRLTKTYNIEMIMDLMRCNAHQEYLSPYGDGYVTHLIFDTKLNGNKVTIKCKGFVTGDVVVDYKNGRASSAHYVINAVHTGKPVTVKNIEEFEGISLDKDEHIMLIKSWVNNLRG